MRRRTLSCSDRRQTSVIGAAHSTEASPFGAASSSAPDKYSARDGNPGADRLPEKMLAITPSSARSGFGMTVASISCSTKSSGRAWA